MNTKIASLSLLVAMGSALSIMSVVSSCCNDKVGYVSSQQEKDNSVKFVLQGVGSLPTQVIFVKIDERGKVTLPKEGDFESVKSCYEFKGDWYKENTCETLWDASKDSATGNTILYGNWSIVDSIEVAGHKGYFMGTFNAKNDPIYWATTNIGTDRPENFGDYYAWGETETHYYNNSVQDTVMKSWDYTSGCGFNDAGFWKADFATGADENKWGYSPDNYKYEDKPETLPDSADVAKKLWGNGWRMPSAEDFAKLYVECDFVWDSINNVKGIYAYRKKSEGSTKTYYGPTNSQSIYSEEVLRIFFPAAGTFKTYSLNNAGLGAFYWSSSLCLSSPNGAYYFYIAKTGITPLSIGSRNLGYPVRAVFEY